MQKWIYRIDSCTVLKAGLKPVLSINYTTFIIQFQLVLQFVSIWTIITNLHKFYKNLFGDFNATNFKIKLRQLGFPNRIVADLNFKSSKFDLQFWSDLDSSDEIYHQSQFPYFNFNRFQSLFD